MRQSDCSASEHDLWARSEDSTSRSIEKGSTGRLTSVPPRPPTRDYDCNFQGSIMEAKGPDIGIMRNFEEAKDHHDNRRRGAQSERSNVISYNPDTGTIFPILPENGGRFDKKTRVFFQHSQQ